MTALSQGLAMARNPRKPGGAEIHDRMAKDLPINSKVAPAVVDDPYGQNGEKLRVVRSVRDDVLGHLHARGDIDPAQYEAGRKYEKFAEQAAIGNLKAMNPMKEAVDGGYIPDPITDSQIAAVRHLSEAARVLGRRSELLVRQILVDKRRFKEIAKSTAERDVMFVRRMLIECLDELAVLWGFAGRK